MTKEEYLLKRLICDKLGDAVYRPSISAVEDIADWVMENFQLRECKKMFIRHVGGRPDVQEFCKLPRFHEGPCVFPSSIERDVQSERWGRRP